MCTMVEGFTHIFPSAEAQGPRNPEELRIAIRLLISELESHPNRVYMITELSSKYKIKRRRLYDVINVFSAIGVCKKSGLDHMVWNGTASVIAILESIRKKRGVDDPNNTLEDIFPAEQCIGISKLTIAFLLSFYSLKTQHLDIRFIAQLFSRGTSRYKTTLCKLYQICYILSSVGITSRTATVCEVIFNKPFFVCDVLEAIEDPKPVGDPVAPLTIQSLLNNHREVPEKDRFVYKRRKELRDIFVESIASRANKENERKNKFD